MKFSMMKQVWLGITLAIAAPLWSQVETNATETATKFAYDCSKPLETKIAIHNR